MIWAHIAAVLFGGIVVATKDYDGEVRIRRASWTPFGYRCAALGFGKVVLLDQDGTCKSSASYVHQWRLVWGGLWRAPR